MSGRAGTEVLGGAPAGAPRHFLSYTGTGLPLQLIEEIDGGGLRFRNTYFRAWYDAAGRPVRIEKLVYGEVEMRHDYRWAADGRLRGATVQQVDEEPRVVGEG